MPPHLSRKDERALEAKLNQAVSAINQGYLAWEVAMGACHAKCAGQSVEAILRTAARQYSDHHLAAVAHAQRTIAAQLARFEDGNGYNLDVCQEHTLNPLATYEEMASNLLEEIASLRGDRQEEAVKGPSGQWTISRSLVISGKTYGHAVGCNNPAVGTHQLDRWEQELRGSEFIACEAAQITAL